MGQQRETWLSAQGGAQRRLSDEPVTRLAVGTRRRRWWPVLVALGVVAVLGAALVLLANRSIDAARVGDCVRHVEASSLYQRSRCDSPAAQFVVRAVAARSADCVAVPGVDRAAGNGRAVCLGFRDAEVDDSPQAVAVGQCLGVTGDRGLRVACGTGRKEVLSIQHAVTIHDDQHTELDRACAGVRGAASVWGFSIGRDTDLDRNSDPDLNSDLGDEVWDYVFCLASPTR